MVTITPSIDEAIRDQRGSSVPDPRSPSTMAREMGEARNVSGEKSGKWRLYAGKCWKLLNKLEHRRSEKTILHPERGPVGHVSQVLFVVLDASKFPGH